jgi:hypothetical protein
MDELSGFRQLNGLGDRMAIIEFIGRILPQGTTLDLPPFPRLSVSAPGIPVFGLTIKIQKSLVAIICDGEAVTNESFVEFYVRALEMVRMIVNLAALNQGMSLTVVLERFIGTEGALHDFTLSDPMLKGIFTSYDLNDDLAPVTTLALADGNLRKALHDLSEAITYPDETAINCGRVVETIRQMIARQGSTDEQAWIQMRTALNIDRPFLQLITDSSTKPRHGNYVHVPGSLNQELTARACKIMNRYLEYRLRGSQPLKPSDFPLLTA